ncbi:MAG: MFS transporter [Thermoplasmata archaeon]|nr:MFS transporter [Thermoplasmata archaeon]
MDPPGPNPWRPASALLATRIVYAFNWYDVGAVLPLIGTGLSASPIDLGIVLASFLLGVGAFQVPAGLAAVRFGSRNVAISGVVLMGFATFASGFAPTWQWLALTRFVAGVGAAFFFAPALELIAAYFPPGRRGPVIGLYNGGFSLGGALGLFGGALIGTQFGFAAALTVGGAVLLGSAAACAVALPADPGDHPHRTVREMWATGRRVLRSRSIWALSLALTGFWAAIYDVAQYFVQYARTVHPDWGYGTAAALAAVVVVISFPTGPIGGWLAERGSDRRYLIALFGALASFGVLLIPFAGLAVVGPILVALGGVDGVVFAILYLIPTYLPEMEGRGLALGVGVVNSIQVLLGSGLAVLFAVLVSQYGFTFAWTFAWLTSLVMLPAVLFVAPNRALEPEGARSGPGAMR